MHVAQHSLKVFADLRKAEAHSREFKKRTPLTYFNATCRSIRGSAMQRHPNLGPDLGDAGFLWERQDEATHGKILFTQGGSAVDQPIIPQMAAQRPKGNFFYNPHDQLQLKFPRVGLARRVFF